MYWSLGTIFSDIYVSRGQCDEKCRVQSLETFLYGRTSPQVVKKFLKILLLTASGPEINYGGLPCEYTQITYEGGFNCC